VGRLLYGSPPAAFELDDRTLAHVEIVIIAKLRRSESFAFSLPGKGDARTSIWISPASDIQFEYASGTQEVSRAWLEALIESANSPQGLRIIAEPDAKGTKGASGS
jgi:hypothetical protein